MSATPEEMKEYGGEWVFNEKKERIGPIFGKDFVYAPWNGFFQGKRVYNPHDNNGWGSDQWCYRKFYRGCVDFETRNNRKLQEYLVNKSNQETWNRGNRVAGKRTRKKRTRKSRKR